MLIVNHKNGVDYVTINRPERLNALCQDAVRALNRYFEDLHEPEHKTRVVVLTGSGNTGFCSGLDLKAATAAKNSASEQKGANGLLEATMTVQKNWSNIVRNMRSCPQPVIGCINGVAYGGGFGIALACDVKLATTNAKFAVQNIKIGLTGGDVGISYFLPRTVGMSIAAELMYTGRELSSERAHRCNLVSEVFGTQVEMMHAAEKLASEMLRTSPLALRLTKDCLAQSIDAPCLESALMVEDRQQVMMAVTMTSFVKSKSKL